jgi:DNA-binding HxlR family transcriptional regulator
MHIRKIPEDLSCGIVVAMKVFGAKWKPCILDAIHRGYTRPSQMQRQILGAAPRVITTQLKELENMGIVQKTALGTFPLHTEYRLTEVGKSILPIIHRMDSWGVQHLALFAGVSGSFEEVVIIHEYQIEQ